MFRHVLHGSVCCACLAPSNLWLQIYIALQDDDDEDDGDDRVADLFSKARKVGARQGTSQDLEGPSGSSSFQGTAHSLTGKPAAQVGCV